jgi:hypothetical protein
MGAAAISDAPLMNALGFTGGGLLAICLIPQIIKLLVTRSARDISLSWTVLYLAGEHCEGVVQVHLTTWSLMLADVS